MKKRTSINERYYQTVPPWQLISEQKRRKRKEIKTGVRIREDNTVIRGTDENTAKDAN